MDNKFSAPYDRCYAKIDLGAIEKNFDNMKKLLENDVKICSVVKTDAYGHGSVEVARRLQNKSDYFAVASVNEGVTLRKGGIEKNVLILSYTSEAEYETVIRHRLTPTIYNEKEAQRLSELSLEMGTVTLVHIAVDTGMGRIGFIPNEESANCIKRISSLKGIFIEGLFSHYAKADYKNKESANAQTQLFDSFISMLEERGVNIPIKHICNSAGVIDLEKHYDMVRFGVALYGLYPSNEVKKERVELFPAMEVISHIIHIKEVEKGTGIGYGHEYIADSKRKIATVSIGYGDGFKRSLSNKGYVLINGKKAYVRGKVCMDQIMVDVTDIENVNVGDIAVVMGKMGDEYISADAIGESSGSFGYEILCTFMPRVTRRYFN